MILVLLLLINLLSGTCIAQTSSDKPTIIDRTKEFFEKKVEWISLNDNESVGHYIKKGGKIYGWNVECQPFEMIDVLSFKVLSPTGFAKDKNYVYFPINGGCGESEIGCICCYYDIIIKKANPETFTYLGGYYAKDDRKAFFFGNQIENAEASTFKVIEQTGCLDIAVDKYHVYINGNILKKIDPQTFRYDKKDLEKYYEEIKEISLQQPKFIFYDKKGKWFFSPPNVVKRMRR